MDYCSSSQKCLIGGEKKDQCEEEKELTGQKLPAGFS